MESNDEFFERIDKTYVDAMKRFAAFLEGLSDAELLEEMRMATDEDVKWMCEEIGLPEEAYRICAAAQTVLKERGLM